MTGTTTVTKQSDFDDYTRSEIYALMAAEDRRCPSCGNFDTLRPLREDHGDDLWTEINGRMYAVGQYRCVACALSELVQRDFRLMHEKTESVIGQVEAGDGRHFVVTPISQPPKRKPEVT